MKFLQFSYTLFLLLQGSVQGFGLYKKYIARAISVCAGCFLGTSITPTLPSYSAVTDQVAIERFKLGLQELKELDKNWDSIVKGEGDNVRRKLGTVYAQPKCFPALCSYSSFVDKFVKENYDDIDVDAFEEPKLELLEALNQADFLAYSSIFSEYGNGGGGQDYIDQSHGQVKRAVTALTSCMKVLEL